MSVTSVGASFSYVNPNAVAGASSAAVKVSDAGDQDSPSTPVQKQEEAPPITGSTTTQFATDTLSAVLGAQEAASASKSS